MRCILRSGSSSFYRLIGITFLAIPLLSGCLGGSDKPRFPGSCAIQQDQFGSFMAMMQAIPGRVTIDSRFTPIQQQDIMRAVAEWNAYGQEKFGRDIFEAGVGTIPTTFGALDPRTCGQNFGGFFVVREQSNTRWSSLQLTMNNPGATFQCGTSTDTSEVGVVTQQVIYINTNVTSPFQMNSILVHEFGHAVGLDHSCTQGAGNADYATCSKLAADHPYRQAVMFPMLAPSETKEVLRANDKERADCLYKTK